MSGIARSLWSRDGFSGRGANQRLTQKRPHDQISVVVPIKTAGGTKSMGPLKLEDAKIPTKGSRNPKAVARSSRLVWGQSFGAKSR
jgi:hypothetical protein